MKKLLLFLASLFLVNKLFHPFQKIKKQSKLAH